MPAHPREHFEEISALPIAYSKLFFFLQIRCWQEQAKKTTPHKIKVPVQMGYLEKMQNNNGRKKSEAQSSLQEHQENAIFALHTLSSSVANLSRHLYKNRVITSKRKDVMFVENYLWIISLPFQNVAIKTHARSFCATLKTAQPLKSDWNQDTTTPIIRLPLKLNWKQIFVFWKEMQAYAQPKSQCKPQISCLLVSIIQCEILQTQLSF